MPMLIVPFSCLREARIDLESITPADIQPERFDTTEHHARGIENVRDAFRWNARQLPDGRWTWNTYRHWLGASLFRANYTGPGRHSRDHALRHADLPGSCPPSTSRSPGRCTSCANCRKALHLPRWKRPCRR